MKDSRLEKIIEKDALLVQAVQPIKILGSLAYPSYPMFIWNERLTANR